MGMIERCKDCNRDNFLIVEVDADKRVDVEVIALTRDSRDALAPLEKYSVPSAFATPREQLGLPAKGD